jgi:hypothetical protein
MQLHARAMAKFCEVAGGLAGDQQPAVLAGCALLRLSLC